MVFDQFAFAADIAAVALGKEVVAEGLDGFAGELFADVGSV